MAQPQPETSTAPARPESELDEGERSQISARLRMTATERLEYLLDMLDFEALARNARILGPAR